VPWRFLDAGRLSVRNLLVAGVQNLHNNGNNSRYRGVRRALATDLQA